MLYRVINSYDNSDKNNFLPSYYFYQTKKIYRKILIKDMVNFFKEVDKNFPNDKRDISFKIKIILDPNLKSCAEFSTNEFNYNFTDSLLKKLLKAVY